MTHGNQQESSKDDVVGYFYTTKITLRNGKVLYAWQKGLRSFRIPIRKPKRDDKSSNVDNLGSDS